MITAIFQLLGRISGRPARPGHHTLRECGDALHLRAVTADFFVKARNFGVTANGVTASAAIPEIIHIKGKGHRY
jgi:hypothetical protein